MIAAAELADQFPRYGFDGSAALVVSSPKWRPAFAALLANGNRTSTPSPKSEGIADVVVNDQKTDPITLLIQPFDGASAFCVGAPVSSA